MSATTYAPSILSHFGVTDHIATVALGIYPLLAKLVLST